MRRSAVSVGVLAVVFGLIELGAASCSTPEDTSYGNPNTLDRKNLPGEGGIELLSCTGDAAAGTFDGGGGCPSFAADIYPYFAPEGPWKCASSACHGGTTAPGIDGKSAASCLEGLRKATVGGKPYVSRDGGKDPAATTLLCNLQGTCGSRMPKPPGVDPTPADLCKIEAWLKCGAPE